MHARETQKMLEQQMATQAQNSLGAPPGAGGPQDAMGMMKPTTTMAQTGLGRPESMDVSPEMMP
jgi:hypothetical protein